MKLLLSNAARDFLDTPPPKQFRQVVTTVFSLLSEPYPYDSKQSGSTLPGQGSDAILVTENPTLRKAGSLRPGTVIQWVAPQGVFAYRVKGSAPIQSLSNLSGVNRESLALVEQSITRKGKTQLFAVFASPEFSSK